MHGGNKRKIHIIAKLCSPTSQLSQHIVLDILGSFLLKMKDADLKLGKELFRQKAILLISVES